MTVLPFLPLMLAEMSPNQKEGFPPIIFRIELRDTGRN
jgi:hypothetical protein